jgi:hypothetical protein
MTSATDKIYTFPIPDRLVASLRDGACAPEVFQMGDVAVSAADMGLLCMSPLARQWTTHDICRLLQVQVEHKSEFGDIQISVNVHGRLCLLRRLRLQHTQGDTALMRALVSMRTLLLSIGESR